MLQRFSISVSKRQSENQTHRTNFVYLSQCYVCLKNETIFKHTFNVKISEVKTKVFDKPKLTTLKRKPCVFVLIKKKTDEANSYPYKEKN